MDAYDLTVSWNGTKERAGEVPGLSGYTGPSQLAVRKVKGHGAILQRGDGLMLRSCDPKPQPEIDTTARNKAIKAAITGTEIPYREIAQAHQTSMSAVKRIATALRASAGAARNNRRGPVLLNQWGQHSQFCKCRQCDIARRKAVREGVWNA